MVEIRMWYFVREILLNKHDFFVKQVEFRVFDNFNEAAITKDAEKAVEEFYERRRLTSCSEGADDADIAQDAHEHGGDLYIMLTEMKNQVVFATLASLYHQWEKDIRNYMENKLKRKFHRVECMLDTLESSGWSFQETSWFQTIEDCRWVVNVYKHGRKKAPNGLVKRHPQFFKEDVIELLGECDDRIWEYRDLSMTPEEFFQIACAFRQFWVNFPSY